MKSNKITFYNYITGKEDTTTIKQWEKYGKSAERMAEIKEHDRQRKRTPTTKPKVNPITPIKPRTNRIKYKDPLTGKETDTTKKQLDRYKNTNKIAVNNAIKRLQREKNKINPDNLPLKEHYSNAINDIKKAIKGKDLSKTIDINKVKKALKGLEKVTKNFEKWKKQRDKERKKAQQTQKKHEREKKKREKANEKRKREEEKQRKQREENANTEPDERFGTPTNKWQQYLHDLLFFAYSHDMPIYADFEFTSDKINELIDEVETEKGKAINEYINNSDTPDFDISDYTEE